MIGPGFYQRFGPYWVDDTYPIRDPSFSLQVGKQLPWRRIMGLTTSAFWDNLAIKAYQQLLKNNPKDPLILHNLGLAYRRQGRYKKAIAAFRKLIRIDASKVETYYHLATTLNMQGQTDAAHQAFSKFIHLAEKLGICTEEVKRGIPFSDNQK